MLVFGRNSQNISLGGVRMAELKGSQTEKNLLYAFAGECQARVKYEYFSSKARKEGYEQISAFFDETSRNEKEHAELWFKLLKGIGCTADNLKAAAAGENEEWTKMYKEFAEVARKEGFTEIAETFEGVGEVERNHEIRYLKLLENVKNGSVFKKSASTVWICRNCGHLHTGDAAPDMCPVCQHAKAYFEVHCANY